MVCVKLLVVDVDGVLANDANVLREVKKKYPNITQLFHAKESHHVHFEGPQLDIINASNDVYAAAGEPFALPAEHARFFVDLAVNYSPDAIEKLLVGLFRQTEKFARDDKLRPGWRVSGPMYGVCASTPERRRELMELCIAKINVTYNVKLTLDVLVEFQTSVPTSVERATALALSQIERGTAASRLSVWQTNDISNHSPNAMVNNQGFVQLQKLCAPPHVGSAIIVAAPFSSHLLFGFGQNDVSPTNEEAEVEELFKEILNARSHHELFRTAHATSSAEAHVPFPFWNAPLVPQSSAVVNNVYRPHTEFQTNVEQAAALTAHTSPNRERRRHQSCCFVANKQHNHTNSSDSDANTNRLLACCYDKL
ncbi:Hypothetical protein, putative [Bodo saltans]|uniref:Uncharacterized protein n=1 Tax=Bodo saltans TaxID=75058 RepID=A0A0S4J739_BODSA|nr:Hypothetical protein, putative [Bodo saltans]|eukprot:CUG85561.1 Hypothetical protein, putative [Bodo saltans]